MKVSLASIFVALVLVPEITAQQSSSSGRRPVVVRLLNGKDGKPITHAGVAIVLGDGPQRDLQTDSHGEVVIDFGKAQDIRAWTFTYFADCRKKGDVRAAGNERYSLDEITSKGVVAENDCGTMHATLTPGVLVLYVRPMTFKERWWL